MVEAWTEVVVTEMTIGDKFEISLEEESTGQKRKRLPRVIGGIFRKELGLAI